MKPLFTVLFFLFFCVVSFAQIPYAIQWQKNYGGTHLDEGNSIRQTSDGGYIVGGASRSNDGDISGHIGDVDGWVIKLNSFGFIEWEKSLGSPYDDAICFVQQTVDGGYIAAGYSNSLSGSISGQFDFFIVKLKNNGDIVWQKFLGGSDDDRAYSMQQTNDGGYILAGESRSHDGSVTGNHGSADIWIVKLSGNGDLVWQKSLGGSADERALSIQQTHDGGYIVAGSSSSVNGDVIPGWPNQMCWLIKLNNTGDIVWQKEYGNRTTTINYQEFYNVKQTSDGGYIVAGFVNQNGGDVTNAHGSSDVWIIKIDPNGNLNWAKSFGGSNSDGVTEIQQSPDGGYIFVGLTNSRDGDVIDNTIPNTNSSTVWWAVKLSLSGTIQWQKCFGSIDHASGAFGFQQTADGGLIIVGDGGVESDAYHDTVDIGIIKFSPNTPPPSTLNIYPNPATGLIKITWNSTENIKGNIAVFDFTGRKIYQKDISQQIGSNAFQLNTSAMPAGGYILSVEGKIRYTRPFIKIPD